MKEMNRCPQCSGTLRLETRGSMQDKVLACDYCGCVVDVPDSYEASRVEESVSPDGTRKRIHVAEHRADLHGNLPPGSDPLEAIRQFRKRVGFNYPHGSSIDIDFEKISEIQSAGGTHREFAGADFMKDVFTEDGEIDEQKLKAMAKALGGEIVVDSDNISVFSDSTHSADASMDAADFFQNAMQNFGGKSVHRERSEHIEKQFGVPGTGSSTDLLPLIKWLVALGVIVLLCLIAAAVVF